METVKKYGRWGWWAIIGLVAILILIGLIIAAIASRNMKNTETNTASVVETTVQDDEKDNKSSVEKDEKTETKSEDKSKTETKSDTSSKKKESSTSSSGKKSEEPAVVTRCKSKAYMDKTLRGSTDLDCSSAEGIAKFKAMEKDGSSSTIPDSSAGTEIYTDNSGSLPKSGPEDVLPIFVILAAAGFLVTPSVMRFAKRER